MKLTETDRGRIAGQKVELNATMHKPSGVCVLYMHNEMGINFSNFRKIIPDRWTPELTPQDIYWTIEQDQSDTDKEAE